MKEISATTIDRARIAATYEVIRSRIRRTPVLEVDGADFGLPSCRMSLKLELCQHSGSFKARGAFAHLLMRSVPRAGVAAASGGNHGAAVAYAAMTARLPAKIFVPTVSSPAKVERIRGYGADLVVTGDRYADALAACERWVAQTGALSIHAFDQTETLLGQGTVGLELEEQAPGIETLLVAVGGGGLIGGIAAWYAGRIKVVGVEPEAAPTLARALEAGRPVDAEAGGIAADSLAPRGGTDVSDRPALRGAGRAGDRRRDPAGAGGPLERGPRGRRTGRGRGPGRASLGPVCARGGRAHRRPRERRQHDGGGFPAVSARAVQADQAVTRGFLGGIRDPEGASAKL